MAWHTFNDLLGLFIQMNYTCMVVFACRDLYVICIKKRNFLCDAKKQNTLKSIRNT